MLKLERMEICGFKSFSDRTEVHFQGGRILNCVASLNVEEDWTFQTAQAAGVVETVGDVPAAKDLREEWWTIRNQRSTGACVGFATADGVLRWHYVKAGLIDQDDLTAPRRVATMAASKITRWSMCRSG